MKVLAFRRGKPRQSRSTPLFIFLDSRYAEFRDVCDERFSKRYGVRDYPGTTSTWMSWYPGLPGNHKHLDELVSGITREPQDLDKLVSGITREPQDLDKLVSGITREP